MITNRPAGLPLPHLFLAVLITIIWGINFIFVTLSLSELPPVLLCALRFLFASVPAIFFFRFPAAPFRLVALYALLMFSLQFGLLFFAMQSGMTPGMASIILQVQVFFSMFFAAVFLKERPSAWQTGGAIISFMGIAYVAGHFDANLSLSSFLLILAAAATWGMGNLITKKIGKVNTMSLVVWGSFIACIPMLLLSLLIEGPVMVVESIQHLDWLGILSLAYIVYASTLAGYGAWSWLISRHPVGLVAPFTLLVPFIGMFSSVWILGESLDLWKLIAGLLVIGGLVTSLFGARLVDWLMPGSRQAISTD